MTLRQKIKFVMDNQDPKTLKEAKLIAVYQWEIICELLDQKAVHFKMYKELEDVHALYAEFIQAEMLKSADPIKN